MMEWHEKEVKEAKISNKKEVTRYVREHDENVELRATDYVQKWLCALNGVKKKAEIFKEGDIRLYF